MLKFQSLKRKKQPLPFRGGGGLVPQPYVRLEFDERGATLRLTDKKLRDVNPDYRAYAGALRKFIQAFDTIRKRTSFQINWDGNGQNDRVYVEEQDELLDILKDQGVLMDEKGRPLSFASHLSHLELVLPPTKEKDGKENRGIAGKLRLIGEGREIDTEDGGLKLLSERYVLAGTTIHEVPPLGEHYRDLPLFQTKIGIQDLKNYLALAVSFFHGLYISFGDYKTTVGPPVMAAPGILFEEVDTLGALRLSLISVIPGFSPEFLQDYEINRVAEIDDFERKVVLRDVVEQDLDAAIKYVRNALIRHRKNLGAKEGTEFFQEGPLFVIERELASVFLYGELETMLERFTLFGTEKLKAYKIRPASTPRLSLRLQHGIDFLEGEGSIEVEGETFNLVDLLGRYRKQGYITLNDGTSVIIERTYIQRLQRLFETDGKQVRLSFFDLPIVEDLIDEKTSTATFPKVREIFTGFNRIAEMRPTLPRINGTLRPYQKYGYKWLRYLHQHRLGGCLADDMGLGKTLQAIALLASVRGKSPKPSLVIMPRTLLFNWELEIKKFYPKLSVYIWSGPNRDMTKARKHDVILTTYGMLRTGIETFRKEKFYYVILDESQAIKNIFSQTSKAVMLLESEHRLALSGTPIENNLGELYSLFRFLNPGMFKSAREFKRRYGDPIQRHHDASVARELQKKIYPFILRRLKRDVLKDLPDKVEQTLYVDLAPAQRRLYETRRLFYREAINRQIESQGFDKSRLFIFQALMELRQIASSPETQTGGEISSPKREVLLGQVLDAVENRHKILIFTNFLGVIETVTHDLEEVGIQFLTMTGATRNRQALVEQFQEDSDVSVFVMTLKTGGLGLNLTAADTIFIFDPWWNVAAENQAIDRTHRIGQKRSVLCYRLICRNTIEEKMMELQQKKREIFEAVISSDAGEVKRLTAEDIAYMLA